MSNGLRVVQMDSTPGGATQNFADRSTDPTPLKDPSGYIREVPKMKAGWMPIVTRSLVSGAIYTGINYGVHKAMKGESEAKDPSAIKKLSTGKIIKQGGGQAVASALSGMTHQMVGQYVPNIVTRYAPTKPVVTGVYKTVGGMLLDGRPTLWNGVKDFIMSVGSDYVSDWVYPVD
jgi:hypothetical protein